MHNTNIMSKWVSFVEEHVPGNIDVCNNIICSSHFEGKCFRSIKGGKYTILRDWAVPTIFEPSQITGKDNDKTL